MKNIFLTVLTIFTLSHCQPKIDFKKIIPQEVDQFAKSFIHDIQNGDIEKCLDNTIETNQTEDARTFLTNVSNNISSFDLDSLTMINARFTKRIGKNTLSNYVLEYEKELEDNFIYIIFSIQEKNGLLKIVNFDARRMDGSLIEIHKFTFKDKTLIHYIFFLLAIISVSFILLSLVKLIKTPIKRKWLWIVGMLFGIVKFKLNWTTGIVGFQLISIQLLGAGISKPGLVAPWTLSFSIPVVAIIFWITKMNINKKIMKEELLNPTSSKELTIENNADA